MNDGALSKFTCRLLHFKYLLCVYHIDQVKVFSNGQIKGAGLSITELVPLAQTFVLLSLH